MHRINCMCLWNCYAKDQKELINFKYFWGKVCYDECGIREKRKSLSEHIQKTYFAKNLILNADENNYIFTIGIDPVKKFEIVMRLENENNGVYVEMNTSEVDQLFVLLHQNLLSNIMYPTAEKVTESSQKNNTVSVKLYQHNSYKLCVNNRIIIITMKGMLKLMEFESTIKILLKNYEMRAILCGNTVFRLLKVCCEVLQKKNRNKKYYAYDGIHTKNTDASLILRQHIRDFVKDINLSEILDELMKSPCDCLSTTFIIDTKINFEKLISLWIAAYYETRLLSEAIRIETFKRNNWPHKFIDIPTLAKTGFFYIGPFDSVQCVFCKLILLEWNEDETPVGEHKKYSPFCPLFLDGCENNIPLDSER